jgi:Zn-dependent metalloprotease
MEFQEGPIRVFDARGGTRFNGYPADMSLRQAALIATWAWHTREVLGITSFPDALVCYGQNVVNAFSRDELLVFGSGDGVVFGDFAESCDVFVHEVGHRVVDRETNLMWLNESGALGEHLADVLAARVRYSLCPSAPWRLGSDLFLDGASCLRDMEKPGLAYSDPRIGVDPQVGHMSAYRRMREDRGGVHVNSGIPGRAFALFASVVGVEEAFTVWRRAMGSVGRDTGLRRFRDLVVRVDVRAVAAFSEVGL